MINGTISPPEGADFGVTRRAERDVVALGVAVAAILMFVGTGVEVLPQIFRSWMGIDESPDALLANAMIINVALVIFGWRRYRELTTEVGERRRAEERARRLAAMDPLTGCFNRRSIGPATDALLVAVSHHANAVAYLMVDIDSFKLINDLHGHGTGDHVLQECARRIAAIMPKEALVARIGGDEFACAFAFDPAHPERIDALACALIEEVARPIVLNGNAIKATISVGMSRSDMHRSSGHDTIGADALLHMADIAMYHAKKCGRNRYFWFEPSMEHELRFRGEMEAAIRAGIPRGEFVPYYEKQIDLETGQLVGFEMLARWDSPEHGLVGPEVFIPLAEDTGVIADLSESVIRQALDDARAWDPRLTLSVNISPLQLRDPWFAQKILKILLEANFPPSRLDIEITESCLHDNIGVVRSLVSSLKNQGIGISLDDFGTGYSSLSQLRTLPFDRIKIDRSFVTSLTDNKDSVTIVQAIIALGEGLGLPITAEGIETEAVLCHLRTMGRFKGQGYLYGRPQSADDTQAFLQEQGLLRASAVPVRSTSQPHDSADEAIPRRA